MEGSHGGKTAEWRKAASLFQPVNNKVVKKKKRGGRTISTLSYYQSAAIK